MFIKMKISAIDTKFRKHLFFIIFALLEINFSIGYFSIERQLKNS